MDNAAIDTERAGLWKTMHARSRWSTSPTLDKQLEDKANDLDATEPAKAKAMRETALFYTRQRTTDLLTQMAVTVQGLSGARPGQEEQCRAGEGRRSRVDHHDSRRCERGNGRPGDVEPGSWCWSRSGAPTPPQT